MLLQGPLLISESNKQGFLDSFSERAQLTLITLPKGKNRRLKIDNSIEFIILEREIWHTPSLVALSCLFFFVTIWSVKYSNHEPHLALTNQRKKVS